MIHGTMTKAESLSGNSSMNRPTLQRKFFPLYDDQKQKLGTNGMERRHDPNRSTEPRLYGPDYRMSMISSRRAEDNSSEFFYSAVASNASTVVTH